MKHRAWIERTYLEVLGWRCKCSYQARCHTCGWSGDDTKSQVTAQQQAEWHVGTKLYQISGWHG